MSSTWEHIPLHGGKYDGKRVFDPDLVIQEDHLLVIADTDGDVDYYQVDFVGEASVFSPRHRQFATLANRHFIKAGDLR